MGRSQVLLNRRKRGGGRFHFGGGAGRGAAAAGTRGGGRGNNNTNNDDNGARTTTTTTAIVSERGRNSGDDGGAAEKNEGCYDYGGPRRQDGADKGEQQERTTTAEGRHRDVEATEEASATDEDGGADEEAENLLSQMPSYFGSTLSTDSYSYYPGGAVVGRQQQQQQYRPLGEDPLRIVDAVAASPSYDDGNDLPRRRGRARLGEDDPLFPTLDVDVRRLAKALQALPLHECFDVPKYLMDTVYAAPPPIKTPAKRDAKAAASASLSLSPTATASSSASAAENDGGARDDDDEYDSSSESDAIWKSRQDSVDDDHDDHDVEAPRVRRKGRGPKQSGSEKSIPETFSDTDTVKARGGASGASEAASSSAAAIVGASTSTSVAGAVAPDRSHYRRPPSPSELYGLDSLIQTSSSEIGLTTTDDTASASTGLSAITATLPRYPNNNNNDDDDYGDMSTSSNSVPDLRVTNASKRGITAAGVREGFDKLLMSSASGMSDVVCGAGGRNSQASSVVSGYTADDQYSTAVESQDPSTASAHRQQRPRKEQPHTHFPARPADGAGKNNAREGTSGVINYLIEGAGYDGTADSLGDDMSRPIDLSNLSYEENVAMIGTGNNARSDDPVVQAREADSDGSMSVDSAEQRRMVLEIGPTRDNNVVFSQGQYQQHHHHPYGRVAYPSVSSALSPIDEVRTNEDELGVGAPDLDAAALRGSSSSGDEQQRQQGDDDEEGGLDSWLDSALATQTTADDADDGDNDDGEEVDEAWLDSVIA